MRLNATSITRPVYRALFAAVVLVFASAIAPVCLLAASCPMPCCERTAFPAPMAGCAEQCGISSAPASQELPAAVTVPSAKPQLTLAALGIAEASDVVAPASTACASNLTAESRHATPDDAPLYLYNSIFLI